jgi:hypothetical protein
MFGETFKEMDKVLCFGFGACTIIEPFLGGYVKVQTEEHGI